MTSNLRTQRCQSRRGEERQREEGRGRRRVGEKRGRDRKGKRTRGGKRIRKKEEEREREEMDESPCTIVGQFKNKHKLHVLTCMDCVRYSFKQPMTSIDDGVIPLGKTKGWIFIKPSPAWRKSEISFSNFVIYKIQQKGRFCDLMVHEHQTMKFSNKNTTKTTENS